MSQHDPQKVAQAARDAQHSYVAWWLKADAARRKAERKADRQ